MTLEQAFEELINQRGWYKEIPYIQSTQYASTIKARHKAGTLGDDVKRKLLIASGRYYRREYWYVKDGDATDKAER